MKDLVEEVGRLLLERGKTIALAESCTGGLIISLLVDFPGISAVLERGVVTYSNRSKTDLLGVPAELIERQGAVSRETARAMAVGIRDRAGTDVGLAVTGIAGPSGGTPEKPVGTVFIAIAEAGGAEVVPCRFSGDRRSIREQSAAKALTVLLDVLRTG
ncbi:MAG: CinA family protein [Deltaproteobacteria bacterium]|nr:CinA family protein [Deltaproteobacteria bacterium]